jgi:hypothetical protein
MTLLRRSARIAGAAGAATIPAILWASTSYAQAPATVTGAPPADEAAVVAGPKAPSTFVPLAPATDAMHVAISMGGQFQTGNSHLWAATGQGKFDIRRGNDAFAASLIGNYARSETIPAAAAGTAPAPSYWADSTNNLQGKIRYDRFLTDHATLYLQLTGTHDTFQAITFRFNVDPGFKYLFVALPTTKLWVEAGYDFQYDLHYTNDIDLERAGASGAPGTGEALTLDSNGNPYLISQSDTIHSSRLFAGFSQAFNRDVSLNLGLEYLQGFGGSGANPPGTPSGYAACSAAMPAGQTSPLCLDPVTISLKSARVNFDALLAASVGGGFSVGFGYSLKYNSEPLPGKVDVDMSGTFNLIYALAMPNPTPPPPPPAPCPAPPPPPPAVPAPAPPAPPAPATIPPPAAPVTTPPPAPAPSTMPPSATLDAATHDG